MEKEFPWKYHPFYFVKGCAYCKKGLEQEKGGIIAS